ncbi:hypothetical protein [Desulforamulus ferrireducens]|uniref:Uncharacterized protein n=1 Tax=Desulforamulus ferrireducens TaxID=1833852 RepID=A0A1S6ITP4_9FIRM|nr:hypothetical protein [Desulforamulus ferrireducens]AQS58144.1 hypothetical protein B0537_02970 [Desulforamulus ferrireducens]
MMKNWKSKAVSGLLALTILVPSAAFATDALDHKKGTADGRKFAHHQLFNQEKQQQFKAKLLELVSKYTPDSLAEWQAALAKQEQLWEELKAKQPVPQQRPEISEETREKLQSLGEQVKSGQITQEQAREQLKALGIDGFKHKMVIKNHPQMPDELKEKLAAIGENLKKGTITQEQAEEQLKALGIEKPALPKGKLKAQKDRPELPAEVKQKLETIKADVESGKLSKEQAREEMQKLVLKPRKDGHPMAQLMEAVEANDEAKIKELLPQMLKQLQERNNNLSNKISESK